MGASISRRWPEGGGRGGAKWGIGALERHANELVQLTYLLLVMAGSNSGLSTISLGGETGDPENKFCLDVARHKVVPRSCRIELYEVFNKRSSICKNLMGNRDIEVISVDCG